MTEPDLTPPTMEDLQRNTTALERSLEFSDRIALGAVITAAIALVVGVIQTMFMWNARNDAVVAELRAQQLRSCVRYRVAAQDFNFESQMRVIEGFTEENEVRFAKAHEAHQLAIVELAYLLPAAAGPAIDRVQDSINEVIVAEASDDLKALQEASREEGAWSQAHNEVLEACERVIRTVRDK